jgi:hypothetical protein
VCLDPSGHAGAGLTEAGALAGSEDEYIHRAPGEGQVGLTLAMSAAYSRMRLPVRLHSASQCASRVNACAARSCAVCARTRLLVRIKRRQARARSIDR